MSTMEVPDQLRAARAALPAILTACIVFAALVGVGLAARFAASFADTPTGEAAREGLASLARLDAALTLDQLGAIAIVGAVVLGQPLVIVGLMLLVERWAGPSRREPKNFVLIWWVQAVFCTLATLIGFAGVKFGLLPSQPLLGVEAAGGVAELILWTFPLGLLALFVADFFRYWFHRAQHHFPLLWRFHSVHHSPRDLDALHSVTHPVEELGNLLLIAVPSAFLIGVDVGQLYLLYALLSMHAYLIHMNVPLHFGRFRNVICDNRYHFIHHSRRREDFDTNFAGLFPVLDRLFGTYRAPEPGPLPPTGFDEGDGPTRFHHYFLASWPSREPTTH